MSAAALVPRQALVLTAGLGTRLRPLTDVRAKPAIPVAGEPIVRRILRWCAASGVVDLVLNLHHLPATLTAVVGDGRDLGVRVRYSWEQPNVLGSAGGPRLALPIVGAERFLIVNGDTMTDLDVGALATAHAAAGALVTLALVPNTEPARYGGVALAGDRSVTGFVRRGPSAGGSFHFIGVQIAEASVFHSLRAGEAAASIGGLYDRVIAGRPGAVRGFVSQAAFWDVGTPADYLKTSAAFAAGAPSPIGRGTRIDPSARMTDCILWDDVEVGARCRLHRCIATDGVRVPSGSDYENAILIRREDASVAVTPINHA